MTSLNTVTSSGLIVPPSDSSSAEGWTTRSLEAMAGDLKRLLENKTLEQYFSQLSSITWAPDNDRRDDHANGGQKQVEVSSGLVWTLVAPLVLLGIVAGIVALLTLIWRCRDRRGDALEDEDDVRRGGNSQDQSSAEYEMSVMGGGECYEEGGGGAEGTGFSRQADCRNANPTLNDKGSGSSSRGSCLVWKRFRGMSPDGMIHLSNVPECAKSASLEDVQSSLKRNLGQGHVDKPSAANALTRNHSQPNPDTRDGKRLLDLSHQLKGQHFDPCVHCQADHQGFAVQPRCETVLSHPRDVLSYPRDVLSHPRDILSHPRDVLSHPRDVLSHHPHMHLEVQNQSSPLRTAQQCCYCQHTAKGPQRNVLNHQQANYFSPTNNICTLQHIPGHSHRGVENPLFADDENDKDCNNLSSRAATKYDIDKLDANGNRLFHDTNGIARGMHRADVDDGEGCCGTNSNHVTRHFFSRSGDADGKSRCQQHQPCRRNALRFPKSPLVEGPDVSRIRMYSAASLSLRKSCLHLPSPRSSLDSTITCSHDGEKSVDTLSLPSSIRRFHASRVQPFDLALPPDAAYPPRGNPLIALLCGGRYDSRGPEGVRERDVMIGNGCAESEERSDDVISVQPNVGSSTTSCEDPPSDSAAGQGIDEPGSQNTSRLSSACDLDDVAETSPVHQWHCRSGSGNFPVGLFPTQRQQGPPGSSRDAITERVIMADPGQTHASSRPDKKINERNEPDGKVWNERYGSGKSLPVHKDPDFPASAAELKRSKGSLDLRDTRQQDSVPEKHRYVEELRKSDKVYRMQESLLNNMQGFSTKGSPDEDYVMFDPDPEHRDSRGIEKIRCQAESNARTPEWRKPPESRSPRQHWTSPFIAFRGYEQAGVRSPDLNRSPSGDTIHEHVQQKELSRYCDRFLKQQKNVSLNRAVLNRSRIDRLSGRRASDLSGVRPTRLGYDSPQSDTEMHTAWRKRRADWIYAAFENFHGPQVQMSANPGGVANHSGERPTPKQLIPLQFKSSTFETRKHYLSPFETQKHDLSLNEHLRRKQPRKSRRHTVDPRTCRRSSQVPFSKSRTKHALQEYAWDYAYLNVGSSFGEEVDSLGNPGHPAASSAVVADNHDQTKTPNNLESSEENSETTFVTLVQESRKKLNTDASCRKTDSTLRPPVPTTVEKAYSADSGAGSKSTGSSPPVSGDEVFGVWNVSPELGSDVSLSCPRTPLMTPLNDEAKRAVLKFVWGVSNPPSSSSTMSPLVPTWTAGDERMQAASMAPDPVSVSASGPSHRTLCNVCTSGDDCDNCESAICSNDSHNISTTNSTTTGTTSRDSYRRSRRQLQLSPMTVGTVDRSSSLSSDQSVISNIHGNTPVVCSKEYWL